MKKQFALALSAVLCMGLFTGCKDALDSEELWTICDFDNERVISPGNSFEDGEFFIWALSITGNYEITDNNTLKLTVTDGTERFKKLSGEYNFTILNAESHRIYIETISEQVRLLEIAENVLFDVNEAMEHDDNKMESNGYAIICSDKAKNVNADELVWNDSYIRSLDEFYTYIEEELSEYGEFEYVAVIEKDKVAKLVIEDNPDDEYLGTYPANGAVWFEVEDSEVISEVMYENLTFDSAYEFYKNYIQNGES